MKKLEKSKEILDENGIDDIIKNAPIDTNDINSMPLNCLEDYKRYNEAARKMNKKLRIRRYPTKPCPIELHPKERVVIAWANGSNNEIPIYLSNEDIDFKEKVKPGKEYELPRCIIDYLAGKGEAKWKWFTLADGSKETGVDYYKPRFSIRTIYKD